MSKYLDLARGVSDGDRSPQPPVSGPEDTLCEISGLSGITPSVASMDSWDIRLAARALGVRLSVTRDDELTAEPASRLTPELRGAILASREDLLFDLLLADALRFVTVERHVEGADPGVVLDAHQDAIDAAYRRRDWPAFRAAIRTYVRAGLREIERAKGLALLSASPSSARPMKEGAS